MGSTSQPGLSAYVGAVCMVEAPESQQPTRSRLSPSPSPSYPQQHKGSLRLKQSLIPLIQSTLQKNVLILCVHDES